MSETFLVNCIKCGTPYKSEDPDPYFCEPCNEQKKLIAKEVDKKISTKIRKPTMSGLQQYDLARGKSPFPSIKSLGIRL